MSKIVELFGLSTEEARSARTGASQIDWKQTVEEQQCPYLHKKCDKIRKSEPDISIGTCSVQLSQSSNADLIICPSRFLERNQVFSDALHLLTLHEPGNELHLIREVAIPGGSVDYFLTSVRTGKVIDYVGIELQALDTTGTIWPKRQEFLASVGVLRKDAVPAMKSCGVNWKMTAKTTLVQLLHKIETFEHVGKHLVLVLQDDLFNYMRSEFKFDHLTNAKIGNPMHSHVYGLHRHKKMMRLSLVERHSTDAAGVARCMGQKINPHIEHEAIIRILQKKISDRTLFKPFHGHV